MGVEVGHDRALAVCRRAAGEGRQEDKQGLVSLSRGGADAHVAREFDVTAKEFVKDGFTLQP